MVSKETRYCTNKDFLSVELFMDSWVSLEIFHYLFKEGILDNFFLNGRKTIRIIYIASGCA